MDGQCFDTGRLQSIGSEGTRFQWQKERLVLPAAFLGRHLAFCEPDPSACCTCLHVSHGWFVCLNVCVASRCLKYFQANCFQMLSGIILLYVLCVVILIIPSLFTLCTSCTNPPRHWTAELRCSIWTHTDRIGCRREEQLCPQ